MIDLSTEDVMTLTEAAKNYLHVDKGNARTLRPYTDGRNEVCETSFWRRFRLGEHSAPAWRPSNVSSTASPGKLLRPQECRRPPPDESCSKRPRRG
jgi:hypothetical protein